MDVGHMPLRVIAEKFPEVYGRRHECSKDINKIMFSIISSKYGKIPHKKIRRRVKNVRLKTQLTQSSDRFSKLGS